MNADKKNTAVWRILLLLLICCALLAGVQNTHEWPAAAGRAVLAVVLVVGAAAMMAKRFPFFAAGRDNLREAGVLAVHLAIIILAACFYLDSLVGFSGEMTLRMGRPNNTVAFADGSAAHTLPFSVVLNGVKIEGRTSPGLPVSKVYYGYVIFEEEGRAQSSEIVSGRPVVFRGLRFRFARVEGDEVTLGVSNFPLLPLIYFGFAALFVGASLTALRPRRGMPRNEAFAASMETTPESAGGILERVSLLVGVICLAGFLAAAYFLGIASGGFWSALGKTAPSLKAAFWILCAATVAYFLNGFFVRKRFLSWLCAALEAAAWFSLVVFAAERWIKFDAPPFRDSLGLFVLAATAVLFVYLVVEIVLKTRIMGFFAAMAALVLLVAGLAGSASQFSVPPDEAGSFWFAPYAILSFVAYAALILAFFFAVIFILLGFTRLKKIVAEPGLALEGRNQIAWGGEHLDLGRCLSGVIGGGFVALIAALAAGALMRLDAWGDYWAWGATGTAALLAAALAAVFLHFRFVWRRSPRLEALLAILASAAALAALLAALQRRP